MSLQDADALTAENVPNTDGLVVAAAGKHTSIRTKANRTEGARMAAQHAETLASVCVPQPYSVIVAPAGEQIAIRAETHRR